MIGWSMGKGCDHYGEQGRTAAGTVMCQVRWTAHQLGGTFSVGRKPVLGLTTCDGPGGLGGLVRMCFHCTAARQHSSPRLYPRPSRSLPFYSHTPSYLGGVDTPTKISRLKLWSFSYVPKTPPLLSGFYLIWLRCSTSFIIIAIQVCLLLSTMMTTVQAAPKQGLLTTTLWVILWTRYFTSL